MESVDTVASSFEVEISTFCQTGENEQPLAQSKTTSRYLHLK